jgi:outer membrane protein assembly factor BamA
MNNGRACQDDRPPRQLTAQNFEGASRISADTLAAATGLKIGGQLSPETVNAARRAILDAYAKSPPGNVPPLKCKMQTTVEGHVTLTWIIDETTEM